MTKTQRVAKLKLASSLIREVLDALDITEETCPKCNHVVYKEWNEAQAYDQLSGALGKVSKWAVSLNEETT